MPHFDPSGNPCSAANTRPEVIRTTDDHPFFVLGRGWTEAELLTPGDPLRTLPTPRGEARVRAKAFTNTRVPGSPTSFVGEQRVRAHN